MMLTPAKMKTPMYSIEYILEYSRYGAVTFLTIYEKFPGSRHRDQSHQSLAGEG